MLPRTKGQHMGRIIGLVVIGLPLILIATAAAGQSLFSERDQADMLARAARSPMPSGPDLTPCDKYGAHRQACDWAQSGISDLQLSARPR